MKIDLSKILNEAWRITFKNKWLWVFGLVLAVTASGGGNGGGGNSSSSSSDKDIEQFREILNSPQAEISSVLGTSTQAFPEITPDIALTLAAGIILLATLIVIAIIIGFYLRGWALSSLIHGVDQENLGVSLGLAEMSRKGRLHAREMIKLQVIPPLLTVFIFGLVMFLLGLGAVALVDTANIISILFFVLVFIAFLLSIIVVSVAVFLGSISLILKNLKWRDAFKEGLRVYKKYFIDVIILGCINCFLGGIVMGTSCLVLLLIGAASVGTIFGLRENTGLFVIALPIVVLVVFILLGVFLLISTIWQVFSQSTWVLLYKQLMDLERPKEQ